MKLITGLAALLMMFGYGCSYEDKGSDDSNAGIQAAVGEQDKGDAGDQGDQSQGDEGAPAGDANQGDLPQQGDETQQGDDQQGDDQQGDDQQGDDQQGDDQQGDDQQGDDQHGDDQLGDDAQQGDQPAQGDETVTNGQQQTDLDIDVATFVKEHGEEKFIELIESRMTDVESSVMELAEDHELRSDFEALKAKLEALRAETSENFAASGQELLDSFKMLIADLSNVRDVD